MKLKADSEKISMKINKSRLKKKKVSDGNITSKVEGIAADISENKMKIKEYYKPFYA